jgi:hypothetical protein
MAKSKDINFPELETPVAPTATTADSRVLPRDIFTSGTLPGNTVIRIGDSNVVIDAANRQIRISDGTNDRVLIGYQDDGF